MPVGASGFNVGIGYSTTRAVFGSRGAEDLFAEARVPRQPLGVDDHVVRLARALRQVVLRVDDLRRPPFRPRQRFQRVRPFGSRAQVDRRQVLRLTTPSGAALLGRFLAAADPWRRQLLDLEGKGELRIRGHAFDDGHHPVHVVAGPHDPFERVAVRAAPDRSLLRLGSRKAREPIGVGQLRRQVAGFLKLQIETRHLLAGHGRRRGAVEIVAGRADADGVLAGLQPGFGKAVPAVAIGNDCSRDRGRRFPRADQHPFHRPFFHRRHLAGERDRIAGLSPEWRNTGGQQHGCADDRHKPYHG
jgi:hypothetical protein